MKKQFFFNTSATFFNVISELIILFQFGLALNQEAFGKFSFFVGAGATAFAIFDLKIQDAIVHFFYKTKDNNIQKKILKFLFAIDIGSAVICLAIISVIILLVSFLKISSLEASFALFLAASISFVKNICLNSGRALLRVLEKESGLSIAQIFASLTKTSIVYGCINFFNWNSLIDCLIILLIATLVSSFYIYFYVAVEYFSKLYCRENFGKNSEAIGIFSFIFKNWLRSLFHLPLRDLDIIVLACFVPIEKIGIYRIAKIAQQIIDVSINPIYWVCYPHMIKNYFADLEKSKKSNFIKGIFFLFVFSVCYFSLLIAFFALGFGNIAFLNKFAEAKNYIILWLTFGPIIMSSFWVVPSIVGFGFPGKALLVEGASFFISVFLLIFLITNYEIYGAILASFLYYVCAALFGLLILQKHATKIKK